MSETTYPAGVTPGSRDRRPSAKCPEGDWENTAAANNHDAAEGLRKHQQRAHGGTK